MVNGFEKVLLVASVFLFSSPWERRRNRELHELLYATQFRLNDSRISPLIVSKRHQLVPFLLLFFFFDNYSKKNDYLCNRIP